MTDFTDSDRDRAMMEAHCNETEDAYFAARPQIDCHDLRKTFQSAFERAWQAARAPLLLELADLHAMKDQYAESLKAQSALLHELHGKLHDANARIAKLEAIEAKR